MASSESDILQWLAGELTEEWQDLGRKLGVSDGKLYDIKANNIKNEKEAKYQMLLCWKKAKGPKATHNNLAEALKKVKRADLSEKVQQGNENCLVKLAELFTLQIVLVLASYLNLSRARYDELQGAKYPGQLLINDMQERGFISFNGITPLINALEELNLDGVKNEVLSLFKIHTSTNTVLLGLSFVFTGSYSFIDFFSHICIQDGFANKKDEIVN